MLVRSLGLTSLTFRSFTASLPVCLLALALVPSGACGAQDDQGGGQAGSGGAAGAPGRGGTNGAAGAGGQAPLIPGCTTAPLDSSGTLNGRYGSTHVMSDGRDYFLQVNEWGSSATQTMAYGGPFVFKMTTQMASVATNGAPTGYPSIFIGANANHTTSGSNLPKAVSALTSVLTTWTWNDASTLTDYTNNSYNAAYDVWFSTNPNGEPAASGPSGGYLMVWLHKPRDAQPIGTVTTPNLTIPGVPGVWDVWTGKNGSKPCISYVARQSTLSLSYDLNLFIKDAVTNRAGTIQSGWYLTNVFAGFEIWRGGVNIETTSFCAVVK